MINRLCIGLGNAGATIVRDIANTPNMDEIKLYAIDSTTANATIKTLRDVNYLCTISDENQGSGRDRERGAAMYKYHESSGDFDEMYSDAMDAKGPVILITSAAGGTGSGSIVPLCKTLLENGVSIIPVIIFPNDKDPIAYHLNANDLLIELGEVGIETYSVFVNPANTVDYTDINKEVVELIEILFGTTYQSTDHDSIDDSDLIKILETPGRFIAISAKAPDTTRLKKELTRKVFSGYQPAWTDVEAQEHTLVKGYALTSMFASSDYPEVFRELNSRIPNSFDEYKNVVDADNDGVAEATVIIAGLPRHQVKKIDTEFNEVKGISDGMVKSTRPKFMGRKKATITKPQDNESGKPKFEWK